MNDHIQSRSRSSARRTPELVLLATIVVLGVAGALLGPHGGGSSARSPEVSSAHIALVERRVEGLRGLRFLHPVPVSVLSPAATRRYGVAEQQHDVSAARQRAQVELMELLGPLPPGTDYAAITGAIYGEQVAGFYDPRRKRLVLVRGAGVDDVTLSHELTHALEDQHFDIDRAEHVDDDASNAATALVEGTATEVMTEYVQRYPSASPGLGEALKELGDVTSGTPLPPAVLRELTFPYFAGQAFVQALRHGTGSWDLVNNAERYRPPLSTAQVMRPDRWFGVQGPAPVALPPAPGPGWRRLAASTFGQFDTQQVLYGTSGARAAARIAAGWLGGRYALWRQGSGACRAPCRGRDALVAGWRVSNPGALGRGLSRWLRDGLHARRGRLPDGSAALVRVGHRGVRLALAPTSALAARLAS